MCDSHVSCAATSKVESRKLWADEERRFRNANCAVIGTGRAATDLRGELAERLILSNFAAQSRLPRNASEDSSSRFVAFKDGRTSRHIS